MQTSFYDDKTVSEEADDDMIVSEEAGYDMSVSEEAEEAEEADDDDTTVSEEADDEWFPNLAEARRVARERAASRDDEAVMGSIVRQLDGRRADPLTGNSLLILICGAAQLSQSSGATLVSRAIDQSSPSDTVVNYARKDAVVNARNDDGMTALHAAAWRGNARFVEPLMCANADLRAETRDGMNILHWATGAGDSDFGMAFVAEVLRLADPIILRDLVNSNRSSNKIPSPLEHARINRHPRLAAIFEKIAKQNSADLSGVLPSNPIILLDEYDHNAPDHNAPAFYL